MQFSYVWQEPRSSHSTRWHKAVSYLSLHSLSKIWKGRRNANRFVSDPLYKPLELRSGTQSTQEQSRLLTMPAEIRLMIWKCVVTEGPIILYRKTGRITYGYLTGEGPQNVQNITPDTLKRSEETYAALRKRGTVHVRLLAVLQVCQMIYVETIEQLYNASTFVCLRNTVLDDFCKTIFPPHLIFIRNLHIHFEFRQLDAMPVFCDFDHTDFPAPWDELTFDNITDIVYQRLPELRTLSVFLQGPIITFSAYATIARSLTKVAKKLKYLDFMVVRFPRPASDVMWQIRGYNELMQINKSLELAGDKFRIIQTDVSPGCTEYDVADLDTGSDSEWRIGTLYTGFDKISGEIESKNYAFHLEQEVSPEQGNY